MSNTTTAVATKPRTILDRIQSDAFSKAIKQVLPKHLTADRFVRIAIFAFTRNPKLKECDQATVLSSLMLCSQYGLEPDGRRAHLVPFFNKNRNVSECTLIIDYKGIAELVMRSGVVSYVHADVIRRGDDFEYSLGRVARHVPWFLRPPDDRPKEAGEVFAVYAMARMRDGGEKYEVMSREEVEAIRRQSKSANSGPWVTHWCEMAKKTPFKRMAKWLPLSPEIQELIDRETESSGNVADLPGVGPTINIGPAEPDPESEPQALSAPDPESQTDTEPKTAETSEEPQTEPIGTPISVVKPAETAQKPQTEAVETEPEPSAEAPKNAELALFISSTGATFDQFKAVLAARFARHFPACSTWKSVADVPEKDAGRILRASDQIKAAVQESITTQEA